MKISEKSLKRSLIISILFFANFFSTAQQSTSGRFKPDNIDDGIVGYSSKDAVVIQNVPSYIWRHGCGPTALGMVIGYYDMFGFSDLIMGDASVQTNDVNNAVANDAHYADYSEPIDSYPNLLQDKSELGGAHTSNCIADFMKTSWSSEGNYYGWSWSSDIGNAFYEYIMFIDPAYFVNTDFEWFSGGSWVLYKDQINNNRPVVLLVDSDGDGSTDHFVTGIGYDEENILYAVYNTWDNDIHWYDWRVMSDQYSWGIYGFTIMSVQFTISAAANPPAGGTLSGTGFYDYEDEVILYAEANNGYEFVNWTNDGTVVSTDALFSFNASENLDLAANFSEESSVSHGSDKITVFPNPGKEKVILLCEKGKISDLSIFDMHGKEIYSLRDQSGKESIILHTGNFDNGVYSIIITKTNNEHFTKKLIIQN